MKTVNVRVVDDHVRLQDRASEAVVFVEVLEAFGSGVRCAAADHDELRIFAGTVEGVNLVVEAIELVFLRSHPDVNDAAGISSEARQGLEAVQDLFVGVRSNVRHF